MKPLHKYPLLILSMFMFLFTVTVQAQDDGKIDKKANELVRAYQADLGFTIEQAADFHKLIKTYLKKRNEINAMSVSSDDKGKMLKDAYTLENQAMSRILDAKQYKMYKKLKKGLQPL